jgi:uncharacterized protein (DUF1800 family)
MNDAESTQEVPTTTRRDHLIALGTVAGLATLGTSGCTRVASRYLPARSTPDSPPATPNKTTSASLARFLNRAGFGAIPADSERIAAMGAEEWLEEQLQAPSGDTDETPGLMLRLRTLDVVNFSAYDLRDLPDTAVLAQMQQAAILRGTYSRFPLRERMVDFWTNHFNIYARKGFGASFKAVDDLKVIRQEALTTFPALLKATAHSPAMLAYLDNPSNRRGVANENYARELMELHTLGVHGGYTQKDVQEVARCLTGWTIEDRFLHRRGTFRFDPEHHDDGPKTVLGVSIPAGGGASDGDRVLDILTGHPATARFIAGKLVRYFYGATDQTEAQAAKLASIYQATNGSIPAMLRTLLLGADTHGIHPTILNAPPLLKRPFDYVVSALRVTGAETDGGGALQDHLAKMGQPLFQWPMPDGYPDNTAAWTGSLLARWNFAAALTSNAILVTKIKLSPLPTADLITALLPEIEGAERKQLEECLKPLAAQTSQMMALLLASPTFQWR